MDFIVALNCKELFIMNAFLASFDDRLRICNVLNILTPNCKHSSGVRYFMSFRDEFLKCYHFLIPSLMIDFEDLGDLDLSEINKPIPDSDTKISFILYVNNIDDLMYLLNFNSVYPNIVLELDSNVFENNHRRDIDYSKEYEIFDFLKLFVAKYGFVPYMYKDYKSYIEYLNEDGCYDTLLEKFTL